MLGAWVGSLRHLVVRKHVKVDGPDALTSSAYTAQFEEVKSLGRSTSTTRTEAERQTALFFNSNPPIMYGEALIGYLQRHPIGLAESARLFAAVHAAMTDSLIQCWRLKRDVGFWRPIAGDPGGRERRQPGDDRRRHVDAARPDPERTPTTSVVTGASPARPWRSSAALSESARS